MDHFELNGIDYFSENGTVVDKNTTFILHIHCAKKNINNDKNTMILFIKDILNNTYKYELIYTNDPIRIIKGMNEIK